MIQTITFYKSPNDILASYSENNVDCRNTWGDWHILANERPVFAPPEVKTNYIDVPGGNGSLDLSDALTRYPTYNNREGSFTFRVMNDYEKDGVIVNETYDKGRWAQRYSEIMEYLHGQCLCAVLTDDPLWFYQGRFSVEGWEPGDTWSEITISYNVSPFKWNVSSSTSEWLWDPFNFETGVIWDVSCKDIYVDGENVIQLPPYTNDQSSVGSFFGGVPIAPTITFIPECPIHRNLLESKNGLLQCPISGCGQIDMGVDIRFINTYLNVDITEHFKGGVTFMPDFLFYGQKEPYEITLKGTGLVSIDFRVGRL